MEQSTARLPQTYFVPQNLPPTWGSWHELIKRSFDIVVSLAALLLLSPVFVFIAVRTKRDTPGPIFYRGPRVGRDGKVFQILKFRTMYERPESYSGPRVTAGDDDRVTPFGKWLRTTKLNELPQLWNVLKGEMSLVGPRPEDPEFTMSWPDAIRQEILSVRPGITSPASVLFRDEEDLLSGRPVLETYLGEITPSKLRLDQLYVRYHSFLSDLDVLFWTAAVLLPSAWKQAPREERLFVGPFKILVSRHVSWFMVDTLVTFAAMAFTGIIWRSQVVLNVGLVQDICLALGFAILFSLTNALRGVNRIKWSQAAVTDALDLLPSAGLALLLAILFDYFYTRPVIRWMYLGNPPAWLERPLLPLGLVIMGSLLAFFGFVVVRYRTRLIASLANRWVAWRKGILTAKERVLIVGGGESGRYAAWLLSQDQYAGMFRVVGVIDDDYYKKDLRIFGNPVLGLSQQIPELVAQHDVGIIVFAIHRISPVQQQQILEICYGTKAEVVLFPDIGGALQGLSNRKGNGESKHASERKNSKHLVPVPEEINVLPCDVCLTKVYTSTFENWLNELEEAAKQKDMGGILQKVSEYREQVKGQMEARN